MGCGSTKNYQEASNKKRSPPTMEISNQGGEATNLNKSSKEPQ